MRLQVLIYCLVNMITFVSFFHFTWLFFNSDDGFGDYGSNIESSQHRGDENNVDEVKEYLSEENNQAPENGLTEKSNLLAEESHLSDTNQQAETNQPDGNENEWKPSKFPNVSEMNSLKVVTFEKVRYIPQDKRESYSRAPPYIYGKVHQIHPEEYIRNYGLGYVPRDMFEAALMNDIKILAKVIKMFLEEKEMERRNSGPYRKKTIVRETVSTIYSRRTHDRMYYYTMRTAKGREPGTAYGVLMKLRTIEEKFEVYEDEDEDEYEYDD